jgi:hypothetical protein
MEIEAAPERKVMPAGEIARVSKTAAADCDVGYTRRCDDAFPQPDKAMTATLPREYSPPDRYGYRVAGLLVSSEFELPGLIAASLASPPDVAICRRPVPVTLEDAGAGGPTWQIAGGRFLLRVPGIARFLLTRGREIAVEAENGAPSDDIAPFLVGTVFGILLHQRKHVALHASGVEVNGKAVLFCGPSGAGKSTLSAALTRRGYPLVADDLCGIALAGVPMVQPDGRQLKLWEQAIGALDLVASRGVPVRRKLRKYYVSPHSSVTRALPIGAVYILREARPPRLPGIEQPNAVEAALLLRQQAYRPLLVVRMEQRAEYFKAAAAIANAAGVFHLWRPSDFAAMPEIVDWLEAHWAEIGLTAKAA